MEIVDYLDLTYLGDDKTQALKVIKLANELNPKALCITPSYVTLAKSLTSLSIVTVANFPKGTDSTETIKQQVQQAIENGISEIDIVFPYNTYLSGEKDKAFLQMEAVLSGIPKTIVTKIILETAVYENQQDIIEICKKLIALNINFIKTSTGTIEGADKTSAATILHAINEFDTTKKIGFKASGGIRSIEDAESYLNLAKTILGEPLRPSRFRIGSSGFG